ncbi:MAG: SpoIIIAC/SpoIIIAD family protein [Christensenellales bacterium]
MCGFRRDDAFDAAARGGRICDADPGFLATLALDAVYGQTMLRAMGIVLITQFAAQVCRDMDAPSIACRAELCGRLLLLGVSLPIFLKLTQMAVGALQ